jgi:hypothetical protein
MPKKKPLQLELFAGAGEVHELGLLGWDDALWTKRFEIELLDGTKLALDLITIRRLHAIARAPDPEPPPAP